MNVNLSVNVLLCFIKINRGTENPHLALWNAEEQLVKHGSHHWGAAVTHGKDDKRAPLTVCDLTQLLNTQ